MKKKQVQKNSAAGVLRYIPVAIMVLVIITVCIFWIKTGGISADTILNYTPDNMFLAAAVMILIFAVKGLSIVFPVDVLLLANGILFPAPVALLVSIAGFGAAQTLPFAVGYMAGEGMTDSLAKKYPKVGKFFEYQNKNTFTMCFFARVIGLPLDVVSLYMGASRVDYKAYISGGLLGTTIEILLVTLIGTGMNDSDYTRVIILLLCRIAVSVIALVIKKMMTESQKQKEC